MYVLDSSALIELGEHRPGAQKLLDFLADQPLITTTISAHEVLAGVVSEQHRFVWESLLHGMTILDHNVSAAVAGARIERELTRSGAKINRADTMIAGICASRGAEIVAFDKDFSKIRGLRAHVLTQSI
ncbi:PIN domain-containing protein [Candidatus Woesearchaeota archaeon]|nr:PIN domain-containing protein [Candidatus Woesearchaeota archaeon]